MNTVLSPLDFAVLPSAIILKRRDVRDTLNPTLLLLEERLQPPTYPTPSKSTLFFVYIFRSQNKEKEIYIIDLVY